MGVASILAGLVPLIVFVLIDSFASLRTALVVAVLFAVAEMGLSYYWFSEVDWISFASLGLLLVLAAVSYKTQSPTSFKLQPAILSLVFAIFFIYTSYVMKEPFLLAIFEKYESKLPMDVQAVFSHPGQQIFLAKVSDYLGFAFLAHGALTWWAALRLSKWWWIALRGIGFYIFMFIAMLIARVVTFQT